MVYSGCCVRGLACGTPRPCGPPSVNQQHALDSPQHMQHFRGEIVDIYSLIDRLIRPGQSEQQVCERLSATKFIATSDWQALKRHEQEFLRCYAVGAASRRAVLIGRSAAAIHSIWTLPDNDAPVYLAHPKPASPKRWPPGVRYTGMCIPEMDTIAFTPTGTTDKLRVTSPVRTAVDIARFHGVRHGVVAMDSLFHKMQKPWEQQQMREDLEATIRRMERKRGINKARQALEWSSTWSESPYESLFRVILRECGIVVQEQMWIGKHVRPDFVWGQLVAEIDGAVKFDEDPKRAALEQLQRENWIRSQLYEVLRITVPELLRDEAACVRRLLEIKARSELLGEPLTKATRERPRSGEHWRYQPSA